MGAKKRKERLSSSEWSKIILEKGIKGRSALLAYDNEQKAQDKFDIVNRGPCVVAEILSTAWEMRTAQEKLDRSKKSHIEIRQRTNQGECVTGCHGQWLSCAIPILKKMVNTEKRLQVR